MDLGEGTGIHREFAADVLANILMRLPPNTRRLLRLVCRHWRDVVGTRTATNLRSRAKTLVAATGYAYVVDDLSAVDVGTGRSSSRRELWTGINTADAYEYKYMNIVGTCNGLICLCDAGGDITVANPVTGEALAIPPLPLPAPIKIHSRSWHESYSFSYLPTARRYKLVHVPCWVSGHLFDRVQVITLGEASWRDVPAEPSVRSYTGYGVVAVDGWVYWAASSEHIERVMSFNLENERVAPIISLPSVLSDWKDTDGWHLAEVHERLGIVASRARSTEVWVMEQGEWSRWYTMRLSTPPQGPHRCLTWPLFVHGEHVLAWEPGLYGEGSVLYRHTLILLGNRAGRGPFGVASTRLGLVHVGIVSPFCL
uniref:Uncharacterized protein n=1 Tax=Avena sativa TaxID=4498 RepID=A0ACD5ZTR7_AVESA